MAEIDSLEPLDRDAFERLVLQLTGRDMDYHARNGTTGLDTAWICYRAGAAAGRDEMRDGYGGWKLKA